MVQTPYFAANQPVLWGFGASFCKMGGLIAKPRILHKPCPLWEVRRVLVEYFDVMHMKSLRKIIPPDFSDAMII